jgi:hypothetical protein
LFSLNLIKKLFTGQIFTRLVRYLPGWSDIYQAGQIFTKLVRYIVNWSVIYWAFVSHAELDSISSLPTYSHKIIVENYQKLYAAINGITQKVCSTAVFINPGKK